MRPKFAASILTADAACLGDAVIQAEAAGVDYVHVDVMDGHFVPVITFGPSVVAGLRRVSRLPLDVHLMIENPDRQVEAFAKAGADILTVQVEACLHLHRVVQQIKEMGAKAGVALNPATPLSSIEEILPDLDLVLVMTVNPGFGGQKLITATLDKLSRLRRRTEEMGWQGELEVDGGINAGTVATAVRAGAQVLVAGAALYNTGATVRESLARLRAALDAG
jgi:ribulose-phosphate 3-epimerase